VNPLEDCSDHKKLAVFRALEEPWKSLVNTLGEDAVNNSTLTYPVAMAAMYVCMAGFTAATRLVAVAALKASFNNLGFLSFASPLP